MYRKKAAINRCFKFVLCAAICACVAPVSASAASSETLGSLAKLTAAQAKQLRSVSSKERRALFQSYLTNLQQTLDAAGLTGTGVSFSGLDPAVQAALQKLATDIQTIRAKSQVTDTLIAALVEDLKTASQTGTPPSTESVQTLVIAVQTAFTDGAVSTAEAAKIALAAQAIVAETGLSAELVAEIKADVQALGAASGITADDVALIKQDLTDLTAALKAARL